MAATGGYVSARALREVAHVAAAEEEVAVALVVADLVLRAVVDYSWRFTGAMLLSSFCFGGLILCRACEIEPGKHRNENQASNKKQASRRIKHSGSEPVPDASRS